MTGFYRPRSSNRYLRMWRGYQRGGGLVYCPDKGDYVLFSDCQKCPKFGVWEKGDLQRCKHEYEELKSKGFYAKDQDEWLEYLRDLDPKTYQRLIEEERERERVLAETETENVTEKQEENGEEGETESTKEQEKPPDEDNEDEEHEEDDNDEDEEEEDDDDESDDWW